MKADLDDFRRLYSSLNDEALLAIDRDELVPMAQQCYDAELSTRGLDAPAEEEEAAPVQNAFGENLAEIASFDNPSEASVARSLLRIADIPCMLSTDLPLTGSISMSPPTSDSTFPPSSSTRPTRFSITRSPTKTSLPKPKRRLCSKKKLKKKPSPKNENRQSHRTLRSMARPPPAHPAEEDLNKKHEAMRSGRLPLSPRHLLSLGANLARSLPRGSARAPKPSRSAICTSKTSAPGATSKAASSGASTISTKPGYPPLHQRSDSPGNQRPAGQNGLRRT